MSNKTSINNRRARHSYIVDEIEANPDKDIQWSTSRIVRSPKNGGHHADVKLYREGILVWHCFHGKVVTEVV